MKHICAASLVYWDHCQWVSINETSDDVHQYACIANADHGNDGHHFATDLFPLI